MDNMQTLTKIGAGFLLVTLLMGGTGIAYAKSHNKEEKRIEKIEKRVEKQIAKAQKQIEKQERKIENVLNRLPWLMRVQIALTGKAHITGTVESVSSSGFNVKTLGTTWNVAVGTSTKFTHKHTLANIRVGDTVKVQGKLSSTTSLALTATLVDNKTFRKATTTPSATTTPPTSSTILRFATVQNVGSTTLGVRLQNGSNITIETSSTTKYFNQNIQPISIFNILVGHTVVAYGTSTSSTTLQASHIYDLSI